MKVNLLLKGHKDYRNGYLNIDPFASEEAQESGLAIRGDVSNIEHSVCDGEADEIVAHDVLDYFPIHGVQTVLENWLRKLKRGGTLSVSVVDYKDVARAILNEKISPDEANVLLHGLQREAWEYRKCALTLSQLTEVLKNKGYKILKQEISNFRAIVVVQRR